MHKHFPVDKVCLLEEKFLRRMRTELHKWTYDVGKRDLGLTGKFFVDYFIIVRIHYPFIIARDAKDVVEPRLPLSEKLRLALAATRSWGLLKNLLRKTFGRRTAAHAAQEDVGVYYHKGLPVPAISHGPHIDTWYGHSYDGVNLWWSIDGVEEDNCVILYPELFGQNLPFDPKSMYITPGVQLPKPRKIVPRPGELLVFNPEILHGTQVNISDSTRVVVSTRLNPVTPRFDINAPFHFEHWFSSEDLARNKLSRIHAFPKDQYSGVPRVSKPDEVVKTSPTPLKVSGRISDGVPLRVCDSSALGLGQRLSVELDDAKLLLFRDSEKVHAFSRLCPHLGVDLADGHQEGELAYCPGHGIRFSLLDGSSRCREFKLRQYRATENDGGIHVQRLPREDVAGGKSQPENETGG
jgi:nitrite reductase/ring-hydroxylating ferredoxin subunit